jgi:5-methyltetrahydropteroyltriglutamate--homocysteine methyltransferase
MILPTSTIGSFPKPAYLKEARARFDRNEIQAKELEELEKKATADVIRLQEEIGLDLLVDGEMYRGDMAAYFAEHLKGFTISGLVRSYGNRYYRKPIVSGPIRRPAPISIDWYRYAAGLTQKPVKAILTGPYTMMDWSFDEHYGSREKVAMALAEVLHEEVADYAKAGARYIQIDEPAVSVRPDEIDLAIRAMRVVTDGIEAETITHICYGDFAAIYPKMLDLAVAQFNLELSNSELDMLALFREKPFTKKLGFGVLDVHSHKVEDAETVKARIRRALEVLPADRLSINPDCGLKTRTQEESAAKLKVMVAATRAIRAELGKA